MSANRRKERNRRRKKGRKTLHGRRNAVAERIKTVAIKEALIILTEIRAPERMKHWYLAISLHRVVE